MSRLESFVHNLNAWDSNYTVTPCVRVRNRARVLAAVGRAYHEEDDSFHGWRTWCTWDKGINTPNLTQSVRVLRERIWEILDEPT